MRSNLRDQQVVIDADDRVAALLALRNTVRELESRLKQVQLNPGTQAQPPAATATAPELEKSTAAPAQAALPPDAHRTPVTSAATSAAGTTPAVPDAPWWTAPWIRLAPVPVLLLGAVWWWQRRRREREQETSAPALPQGANQDDFSDWANVHDSDIEPDAQEESTSPQPAELLPHDSWPPAALPTQADGPMATPIAEGRQESQAAASLAPTPPENTPASLELDMRPATEVDFPLMLEDSGDDKERRRRYIEMRYPEVANGTVTVDDPDSVINAARQYFEEGQIQGAAELLTYAFEEHPGQLRFWLALFEIYRLERMTTEFCELAAHFRGFHSGTDVWPKVQHIGRDLDPSNPLFAEALGSLGLPPDRDFDPIAENWLNAPMDFTSDVLMAELRRSLLEEFGVDSAALQRLQPAAAS
jgi:hypothetical protein